MFNKLKVKVAEEVKNSHQRLQQFTQSFTERVENAPSEESFFSIGDDDGQTSSSNTESGFSNVPLTSYSSTPNSGHIRRGSNTSIASDVSFLPHYESPSNLYHMQSDLDISASEVEDNASTSSQLGRLTKEQIYSAFQKAQQRYHKYRGRYADIARHYKDLERENTKIRSVLVETQDKALRRLSELREQCSLEQKAKAHLENSLRVDLDEKQYIIDSLKTKVDLLQKHDETESNHSSSLVNLNDVTTNIESSNSNLEAFTKDLKDARTEIEILNAKIQEMKANSIIFNSKEIDFKKKITDLEEINKQKNIELSEVLERERENNLIIAQTKLELHAEIQNKDLQMENLKHDIERLQSDLDTYDAKLKASKTNKLENYQSQNTKLIEKVEELMQKCKNYESDLLKMEQYKIENQNLHQSLENNSKQIGDYEKQMEEKENLLQQQKFEHANELSVLRDNTKQSLLTLESKIKSKLQDEYSAKEEALTSTFQEKIQHLTEANDTKETQLKLLDQVTETKNLEKKQKELEEIVEKEKERYKNLETNHLDLISESSNVRCQLLDLQKKIHELSDEIVNLESKNAEVQNYLLVSQNESSALIEEKTNLHNEIEIVQNSNVALQNEVTKLHQEIEILETSNTSLQNENSHLQSNKDAGNLAIELEVIITNLQKSITTLQQEKSALMAQHKLLQDENSDLVNKIATLEFEKTELFKLNDTVADLSENCSILQLQLKEAMQNIEEHQVKLAEKEKEKEKVVGDSKIELEHLQKILDETQLTLKEAQLKKLEAQNKLKEETVRFREEIKNLNGEITKCKEYNYMVQGYIDEYKLKLSGYETQFSESATHLQSLTNENITFKNEITKLKDTLETSNSINANLTQQFNNMVQENNQILATEELINKHIEDTNATFTEKIKLFTELHIQLKEKNIMQENEHDNLNTQLKDIREENKILKEQIKQHETEVTNKKVKDEDIKVQLTNYTEKCKSLNEEVAVLNTQIASYKEELSDFQNIVKAHEMLQNEKEQLCNDLTLIRETVDEVSENNNKLSKKLSILQEQEAVYIDRLTELQNVKAENTRIIDEISELKRRNNELSLDYKQTTAENEEIVTELAETKLKLETVGMDKLKNEEIAKKIDIEKAELLNELKQYRNELDKLKSNSVELENIQDIENIVNDNKSLKLNLAQFVEKFESCEKQRRILEGQLRELENQYTEISHEKQLLQDEIQELKISPINIINDQKFDNLDVIHSNEMLSFNTSSKLNNVTESHQLEIDDLNEKLVQYKSLDLTNRSSLQFYENELQKLRNKNEKLNRTLDETLVTLSHCTELSHSTETEYLKNVLYNYMLGKESIVLARVIAAVCKFDESQTNAILQREQQKQTLLGQLGLL